MLTGSHAQPWSVMQTVVARATTPTSLHLRSRFVPCPFPRLALRLRSSLVPAPQPRRRPRRPRQRPRQQSCHGLCFMPGALAPLRRRIRAGSAATRLPWCRSRCRDRLLSDHAPCRLLPAAKQHAAGGVIPGLRPGSRSCGLRPPQRRRMAALCKARAREREAVSAPSRGPRPGTPTRHPVDPGSDPERVVFAHSENALRIMPPLAARSRHGSRADMSPLLRPAPTHHPEDKRISQSTVVGH
jgi:hypothetical protein